MSASTGFLLDTNIVLHATREASPVAQAIERQFGLMQSRFRPAICEVSIAEIRERDRDRLRSDAGDGRRLLRRVSDPGHLRSGRTWAELRTNVKEAVHAHYFDGPKPQSIRLRLVRDEMLAVG